MFIEFFNNFSKFFLNAFPVPEYLKMPSVGFSISEDAVRFVEFVYGKHGFVLGRYGEERIPLGVIEAGIIKDKITLVSVLKKIKDTYKLKYINATLPDEKAYIFKTEIPVVDKDLLRESLEFKIDENVPIHSSEAVFDYSLGNKRKIKDQELVSVSVTVLPSQVVSMYIDVIQEAGMFPLSFMVESGAVTKSVIQEGDNRSYMIVNIDKTKTGLYIVDDNTVQFASTLAFGSDSIKNLPSRDVIEKKNLLDSASVKEKQNFSLVGIKEEIKKIYMYWITTRDDLNEDLNKTKRIEKIIICGEGTKEPGVFDYVSSIIPVGVEKANVWCNVFSFEKYIPELNSDNSFAYAASAGVALLK